MNQINPTNADVTVNVPPQVLVDAANNGTLQNVKSVEKQGDALVVVTNEGNTRTVTGQAVTLDQPDKKANQNLTQIYGTLTQHLDPTKDTQVQFNMAMVINLLFQLQEESYKSASVATLSNMVASLASTKSAAQELKTAAVVGLAFGVASGAIQMGAGAYGAAGEGKSLSEAGNQTVFREVSAADIAPPEEVDVGDGIVLKDVTEELTLDNKSVMKNADGTKGYTRAVRMDDQEFNMAYQASSRTRMAKSDIMKAVGSIGNSIGQGTSGIIQSKSKMEDAYAKMEDAMQGMNTQAMQRSISNLQQLNGIIQSMGDSQNQTLGAIGQSI